MEKNKDVWAKIVARAWEDSGFKQRLLKNPQAVCKEYGIKLPEGVEFRVVENTDKVNYIILPYKPEGLREEELKSLAAGYTACIQQSTIMEPR